MPRSRKISAEAVSLSTGIPHKGWARYLRGQMNYKVFVQEGEVRLKVWVQGGGPERAEKTTLRSAAGSVSVVLQLLPSRTAGRHWNSGATGREMRTIRTQNLKGQNLRARCLRIE